MTFLDKNNKVKHWEIQNKWQVSFHLQSLAAMNSQFFSDYLHNFKLTLQDTACLELVHGDDPERCYGEGGGRGVHVWEHM